jgi:ABC-2 type transport system permease protein
MTGWQTLFYKEVLRFWKVSFQTVAAPVLTAVMYLLVFGHALEDHVKVYETVSYTAFLIPGLVMMSVLQNAFANSSSSLIQSKITGNIVFLLLPPLTALEFFGAYLLAAVVRGRVRCSRPIFSLLPDRMMARSMTLRSSRTLPGQS